MTTFIVDTDLIGSEMERPFIRYFVDADTADEAQEILSRSLAKSADGKNEAVRGAEPLQPVLDRVRAEVEAGKRYSITWKHEGSSGPVTLYEQPDADAAPVRGAVPFGSDPEGVTVLPWMRRSDAKRLAKYLGLTLEEW